MYIYIYIYVCVWCRKVSRCIDFGLHEFLVEPSYLPIAQLVNVCPRVSGSHRHLIGIGKNSCNHQESICLIKYF